jgi:ribosomal protein S18 acetylase RimI-like enzyme
MVDVMTRTVIRSGSPEDANVVLELWRRAGSEPSVGEDVDSIRRLLDRDAESLIVAELDGQIVGTLIAVWDGWRGNLYRLAVLPDHRRQGIASALLADGDRRLRAHGCRRVTALVMHEHDWAVRFWHATHYELDERIIRYVGTLT